MAEEQERVDWKERCMVLEKSLQQFREQVAKIRNTLGLKVGKTLGENTEYAGFNGGYNRWRK